MRAWTHRTLVFGIVSGVPDAPTLLQAVCETLGRSTGWIVIPQIARSYAALFEQIARHRVHIAWAPPLVAFELDRARSASVVLSSVRGGRAAYHSAIFVRRDSPIRSLDQMTGRDVAWVDVESCAGYVVPRLRIVDAGLDPTTLFGRESFHHTHHAVARAVLSGAADVGATYLATAPRSSHVASAGWLEAGAAPDAVRVLATAGPIPPDGIVVSTQLSAEMQETVSATLQRLARTASDELRRLLHVEALQAPPLGYLEALRQLARQASSRSGSRPAIDVSPAWRASRPDVDAIPSHEDREALGKR